MNDTEEKKVRTDAGDTFHHRKKRWKWIWIGSFSLRSLGMEQTPGFDNTSDSIINTRQNLSQKRYCIVYIIYYISKSYTCKMSKVYKQTLMPEKTYEHLNHVKQAMSKMYGKRSTLADVIDECVTRNPRLPALSPVIRNYIFSFMDEVNKDADTRGALLFGSVAKGTFNKYSDIDILLITTGARFDYLDKVEAILKGLTSLEEELWEFDLYLHITPLIMIPDELKTLRPIYFDFLDYGIILFERYNTLTDLFNLARKIKHRRIMSEEGMFLEWKI